MRAVLEEAVETLVTLTDDASRAICFDRRPELLQATIVDRLIAAAREQLHVDRRRSLALAQAAHAIARRLEDEHLRALTLRAQGNALWALRANQKAVECHEQALAVFDAAGDEAEAARTLNALLQPLIHLGRYDEAIRAAGRARELFTKLGDGLRLARLTINTGNIFHRQDRFEEALASYALGREQVRALGDVEGIVTALHNEAVTLTSLMRFPEALAKYEAARELCVEHRMPLLVVQTDYNIAWMYYLRSEYARAIDLLNQAADAFRTHDDRYHSALCQLDLSEIYVELGLNADAREMAEQACTMFDKLGMRYESAKALANTAIAFGREGLTARALDVFDEARRLFVFEDNHVWPSLIDLYRAVLLFQEGRIDEAQRLCDAALGFFASSPLLTKAALCHLLQARLDLHRGDVASAHRGCQNALRQIAELDTPALRYEAHLVEGQVCAAAGERSLAAAAFEVARRELERLRGELRGDELKIAFVRNKQELYEGLITLCLDEGTPSRLEEAFSYVEQAKCRSLLDLIARPLGSLADVDEMDDPTAARIRELRLELNAHYRLLETEQLGVADLNTERFRQLEREVAVREKELTRVLRQRPSSRLGEVERYTSTTLTLEQVRHALPSDAVLLEYFQTGDRLLVWLVTRDRLRVVPLASVRSVDNCIRRLRFQLAKFQLGDEYVRKFESLLLESVRDHLSELHAELLGPIWDEIRGMHLLVVPHRLLHYVPFHALHDGDVYVIDACTVSYAPSASVYALADRRPATTAVRSLVLAVPDARAPLIEAEARQVAEALPEAKLYVGAAATLDVLRSVGSSSRVVHIASHGYFRQDNPMFSAIGLGDSYLNVYDLYRLRLPAELVTLSGCATGLNVAAAGDEILGISRGLLCAGARSLLLSLWDVHDEGTTSFMTRFYRARIGEDTASAVRDAMRETKARHPHPYYWAPFALVGKFRDH